MSRAGRVTRAAVIVLVFLLLAAQLDIARFSTSYVVYLFMVPWALAFLVASLVVIAGVDGKRDWFSLTLLAAMAGTFLTSVIDERRWPLDETEGDVSAAWWLLTQRFAPVWTKALAVGMVLLLWRWLRADQRAAPLGERLLTYAAGAIGALGFPMAPASVLALYKEEWRGGAGFSALYPATVVSFALFGAALRGPFAVRSRPLGLSLCLVAAVLFATVTMASLEILPTAPPFPNSSFFSTPLWKLLALRELGLGFAALASAWLALAVSARWVGRRKVATTLGGA